MLPICPPPACTVTMPPASRRPQTGRSTRGPTASSSSTRSRRKDRKISSTACPYGAIRWNEELQLPQKCTLCAHLLDDGWTKTRCVQSCPTGALTVRHVEGQRDAGDRRSGKTRSVPAGIQTRPHVFYRNLYRLYPLFHRWQRCSAM